MNCPNCNTLCGENDRFCYLCGTPLGEDAVPVSPKKGSHRVPVLILVILSILGTVIYFATANQPKAVSKHPSLTPWFYIEDGYLYFDESLYTGESSLTVPSQVDGETVFAIGEGCFYDCDSLTEIILPDSLVRIETDAFSECDSLRGIFIPASVQTIGEYAFYHCAGLEAVCIPDSVAMIGGDAFTECNKLYYIFYLGSHDAWTELYDGFINPYTAIFCEDGSFYQGGDPW